MFGIESKRDVNKRKWRKKYKREREREELVIREWV